MTTKKISLSYNKPTILNGRYRLTARRIKGAGDRVRIEIEDLQQESNNANALDVKADSAEDLVTGKN